MAHLIENSFSTFYLTEDEELQGSIFTVTQLQYLQNQLANIAEEKLALVFDTSEPLKFAQDEAYKRGQVDVMQYLIQNSEASTELLKEMQNNPENLE